MSVFNENFADRIAECCYKKYNTLPKTGKPNDKQWTLLAGIVKVVHKPSGDTCLEVVSIGTGSKCVGQSKMSCTRLNDSHAEVIARRGFLRYLYHQVHQQLKCGNSDIFSSLDNRGCCMLKDNISFHFFTSHTPCGDASIFPKNDSYINEMNGYLLNTIFPVGEGHKNNSEIDEKNVKKSSTEDSVLSEDGLSLVKHVSKNSVELIPSMCEFNHMEKCAAMPKNLHKHTEPHSNSQMSTTEIPFENTDLNESRTQIKSQERKNDEDLYSLHCAVQKCEVQNSEPLYKCMDNHKRNSADCDGIATKRLRTGDIYRTGSKCLTTEVQQDPMLPGADYHVTGVLRGKPGRGERSLSLSCSDKLARWTSVGMQGALISLLLNAPIYYKTLTVGGSCPYSHDALHRALVKRLVWAPTLELPYTVTTPLLLQSALPFPYSRQPTKIPCPSSIVWSLVPERPLEVAVNGIKLGVTKKAEHLSSNYSLMICKKALLRQFLQCKHIVNGTNVSNFSYYKIKQMAVPYYEAWKTVRRTCFQAWPVKEKLAPFTAE